MVWNFSRIVLQTPCLFNKRMVKLFLPMLVKYFHATICGQGVNTTIQAFILFVREGHLKRHVVYDTMTVSEWVGWWVGMWADGISCARVWQTDNKIVSLTMCDPVRMSMFQMSSFQLLNNQTITYLNLVLPLIGNKAFDMKAFERQPW